MKQRKNSATYKVVISNSNFLLLTEYLPNVDGGFNAAVVRRVDLGDPSVKTSRQLVQVSKKADSFINDNI